MFPVESVASDNVQRETRCATYRDAVCMPCGWLTVNGRWRIGSDWASTCRHCASLAMTWSSESFVLWTALAVWIERCRQRHMATTERDVTRLIGCSLRTSTRRLQALIGISDWRDLLTSRRLGRHRLRKQVQAASIHSRPHVSSAHSISALANLPSRVSQRRGPKRLAHNSNHRP